MVQILCQIGRRVLYYADKLCIALRERPKRAQDALGYNSLVPWPDLAKLAQGVPAETTARQGELI